MKEEIGQKIVAVINALNSITVSGKANLMNLSGSIDILEEIFTGLRDVEFVEPDIKK